jgi:hypothetical protein
MRTRGADVALRRVIGPGTVVQAGWRLHDRTFTAERPDAPEGLVSGYQLGVDHRLIDRRRYRFEASARFFQSASALGADVSYPIGQVALKYYGFISMPDSKPMPRTFVAAQLLLGRGGAGTPLDQMFTPGASSEMDYPLRAHRQKSGGVLGEAPIARHLDLVNLELRQRLFERSGLALGAVVFYDGAHVRDAAQIGQRSTLHDVGLGLRLAARGAILRVDYGHSLSGDGKNAWTAGIGQVF